MCPDPDSREQTVAYVLDDDDFIERMNREKAWHRHMGQKNQRKKLAAQMRQDRRKATSPSQEQGR